MPKEEAMPKMKFNTRVKYKGTVYKGLEPFDVDEADVPEMQARGGVLIVEHQPTKPKAQEPEKAPDKPEDGQKQREKKKAAGDN